MFEENKITCLRKLNSHFFVSKDRFKLQRLLIIVNIIINKLRYERKKLQSDIQFIENILTILKITSIYSSWNSKLPKEYDYRAVVNTFPSFYKYDSNENLLLFSFFLIHQKLVFIDKSE